ncbi:MAG: hypothetical protein JXM79_11200 [Sedimentisphaerales bacterium]|nr:hypothetical protein [Sedimentisphaerales bacterium]
MATQAQLLANRRNAQQSTGPRTAEGKALSAKNATKHGLFARYDVVISEDQGDYDALRESLLKELAPEGTMENLLAERIVSLTWRIKRAARMQNEMIDVKIRREINDSRPELSESLITGKPCDKSKYSDKCYDDQVLGYIAMRDFAGSRALERLSMYERRFEASLFRTMGELKKLQHARKQEPVEAVEMEADSYRGQDARVTRGRDARDTARATECAKQSQFSTAQNDLNAFEKREYELLLGAVPVPNKANDPQQRMELGHRVVEESPLDRQNL